MNRLPGTVQRRIVLMPLHIDGVIGGQLVDGYRSERARLRHSAPTLGV